MLVALLNIVYFEQMGFEVVLMKANHSSLVWLKLCHTYSKKKKKKGEESVDIKNIFNTTKHAHSGVIFELGQI